jgi:hypothetical protein
MDMNLNSEALKNLKLTADEFQKLIQKRDEAGVGLAGFPNSEEIQRIRDLRVIAASKASKRGAPIPADGFDIDAIRLGMSPEAREKACAAIIKALQPQP